MTKITNIMLCMPGDNREWRADSGSVQRYVSDGVYTITFKEAATAKYIRVIPGRHALIIAEEP